MQKRYGLDKSNTGRNALIGAIVLFFTATLGFVGYSLLQNDIQFKLLAWDDLAADRVDITFEVRRDSETAVDCVLRAQDRNRIDVGYAIVTLAAGEPYVRQTYALRTLAPAFTAELLTCVASGDSIRVPGPQFPAGVSPPDQPWTPSSDS